MTEPTADQLVDRTLELLAIDTSNPPGETDALAELLTEMLTDWGLSVDTISADPAKPNLITTVDGHRSETLLLLGHLDTVPFDRSAWSHDPLGERVGDRIYGRGATDMKGPLAAMLEAMHDFTTTAEPPPVTIQFAAVSDEETAGEAGLPAVLETEVLDDATACVIGETTCSRGRHSITVADRGSIWLTLEATGSPAHGSRPVLGTNAIDRLYDAIESIRNRIGTRTLSIPPEIQPIIDESVTYYTPSMGEAAARELFTHPSINLGTVTGGERVNIVPASANAELDIRIAPGVDTKEILGDIRSCVGECDGIAIVDARWSRGTAEPIDSPLVRAVSETATDVIEEPIERRCATGGGDAKKLRAAGIPTVEFALGTDSVHETDEYTTVEAIRGNAEIYSRLPSMLDQLWD